MTPDTITCAEVMSYLSTLDLGNRQLLSDWLRGRMADHDTIICLSTAEDAKDPGVEGVAAYWVQGGKVERIGEGVKV